MESITQRLARLKARQAGNEAAEDLRARLVRAGAMYQIAQDWPRCGQNWPQGRVEEAADALLRANPSFGEGVEE